MISASSKKNTVTEELRFNTEHITTDEVRQYIRKTTRWKAAGPDEIPIEFLKKLILDSRISYS